MNSTDFFFASLFVYPAACSTVDSLSIPNSERFDPVIVSHDLTVALSQGVLSKELHLTKSRSTAYIAHPFPAPSSGAAQRNLKSKRLS